MCRYCDTVLLETGVLVSVQYSMVSQSVRSVPVSTLSVSRLISVTQRTVTMLISCLQ